MDIPFTQYVLPDGRAKTVSIKAPTDDVARRAKSIIERGFRFECEILGTGDVSLTVTDPDEGDMDIELCRNGPAVLQALERLVTRFPDNIRASLS